MTLGQGLDALARECPRGASAETHRLGVLMHHRAPDGIGLDGVIVCAPLDSLSQLRDYDRAGYRATDAELLRRMDALLARAPVDPAVLPPNGWEQVGCLRCGYAGGCMEPWTVGDGTTMDCGTCSWCRREVTPPAEVGGDTPGEQVRERTDEERLAALNALRAAEGNAPLACLPPDSSWADAEHVSFPVGGEPEVTPPAEPPEPPTCPTCGSPSPGTRLSECIGSLGHPVRPDPWHRVPSTAECPEPRSEGR